MKYGVFQVNAEGNLVLIVRFDTIEEAELHAQSGVNMIILKFVS
jgi:hypothetical protein